MKLAVIAVVVAACSSARSDRPPRASHEHYARHVVALRARLARLKLDATIRIEEPFVLIGDSTDDALAEDARTVRWAVDHLEADFFTHRPSKILDIFLFHDGASYERRVIALTGEAPTTPFGFYSSKHGGLFMNIATGSGTLVHEIVHPYVEADFPNAPPWLNEGLGSLFEQCDERDGHIVGLVNWRLRGLQEAIEGGDVPSFQHLTHLDANEFYSDDRGLHYAESRYLLYYLQAHGTLRAFYRASRAARTKDPSGYATLVATLGESDMDDFHTRWVAYVSELSLP